MRKIKDSKETIEAKRLEGKAVVGRKREGGIESLWPYGVGRREQGSTPAIPELESAIIEIGRSFLPPYLVMQRANTVYSSDHGQVGEYFWFESNGVCTDELLLAVPELVEAQYVVRTYFDSEFLVPFGLPEGVTWERWFEIGLLGIIANAVDINTCEYSEFWIFSNPPDPTSFAALKDNDLNSSLGSIGNEQESPLFWERLKTLAPDSYISDIISPFLFVTRHAAIFDKFLRSEAVTSLPTKHPVEADRALQSWLYTTGQEVGPEKCIALDCAHLRMRFSVMCGRHHLDMLEKSAVPDD